MRRRFGEEQIIGILREQEAGRRPPKYFDAKDLGCDILQVESEVWRHGSVRREEA
jgi:hypothetical protein